MKSVSYSSEQIFDFFQEEVLRKGEESAFVKRKSKLNPLVFFKAVLAACLSDAKITLESICGFLKAQGINISRQGLHQRMTGEAVSLFQTLFSLSLTQFNYQTLNFSELVRSFSQVNIIDSSTVSLPNSLQGIYKGCGGSASKAAVKLQVLYNYTEGQIKELTLTQGCENDQGFDHYFTYIKAGALYLMDLGYFKLASFQKIIEGQAYFINRFLIGTKIYNLTNNPLHLVHELQKSGTIYSQEVYLGAKTKIKVRLIAQRLSDQVVEKRIRDIKEGYRRRGMTPGAEKLALARWSIYITNVSNALLPDAQIHETYALRWQIELLFKLSKSTMGIDIINSKKPNRILIELYAKLICLVILLFLSAPVRFHNNKELSFFKASKLFLARKNDFFNALTSLYKLKQFTKNFFDLLKQCALKEIKKKKSISLILPEMIF
jgi:hypothetical protein